MVERPAERQPQRGTLGRLGHQRDGGLEVHDGLGPPGHGLCSPELREHAGAGRLRRRLAQRAVEVVDGRVRRALPKRTLGCRPQHRHYDVVRGRQCLKQVRAHLLLRRAAVGQQPRGSPMDLLPLGERQPPVDRGPHERMREAERVACSQHVRTPQLLCGGERVGCRDRRERGRQLHRGIVLEHGDRARERLRFRATARLAAAVPSGRASAPPARPPVPMPPRRPASRRARSPAAARGPAAGCRP